MDSSQTYSHEVTASETVVTLSELFKKHRPAVVTLADGSVLLYSDQAGEYRQELEPPEPKLAVSSIDSFVRIVTHVLEHRDWSPIVTVTKGGATCVDADDPRSTITYTRIASAPWKALKAVLGQWLSHGQLIDLFRRIAPGLSPDVLKQFRKISAIATTQATSAPELIDGEKSSSIALHLKVKSVDVDVAIPGDFLFSTPYTIGSTLALSTPVFVNANLAESGAVVFQLDAPELESLLEKIVVAEAETLREELGSIPVIENY